MKMNKGEIELLGRINGMGESDREGSYAAVRVSDARYAGAVAISEQQAIDLARALERDWPEALGAIVQDARVLLGNYRQLLRESIDDIRTAAERPSDGFIEDARAREALAAAEADLRRIDALIGKA